MFNNKVFIYEIGLLSENIKMSKRTSLKDIAEKVGVSKALVSYVINGKEKEKRVGKEVVKKIREAALELNYQPNQIARSLRKGFTKTIGLIVADIANPFFGNLARVIEDEASSQGYTVIFGSSEEDKDKSATLIDTLINRQVDGFIIVPAEGTMSQIQSLQDRQIPLVLVDRYFNEVKTNYVILDNFGASYNAVSHLIEKGYRKIGMIAYKSNLIHMQERIRGYSEAMKNNNLVNEIRIEEVRYNYGGIDVEKAIIKLTKGEKKIEALFNSTNSITISSLYCIMKLDLKIPKDLAIIGYDGNEAFDFFYAPLTYIKQPISQIGKESVRILIDQINGSNKVVHITLPSSLIKRQSCL